MNYNGIEQFATGFYQQILAESNIEGEEKFSEDVFVEKMLDYLHELQELENGILCNYKGRGMKVNAYDLNTQENAIDILIAYYDGSSPPPISKIRKNDIETAFKRATLFLTRSFDGYYEKLEESTEVYDLSKTVYELRDEIVRARIILLTDGITGNLPAETEKVGNLQINYQIWDIERVYRAATSGMKKEPVFVDFVKEFNSPVECISKTDSEGIYTTYLAIISGEILSELYEKWGTRILERNVRAFLQARGKVNKGIADTIKNQSGMFLAYNNGITATADFIELVDIPSGGKAIAKVRDFQIVNGGQTTASLFHTGKKYRLPLCNIGIQMKLTVLSKAEQIEEIAPLISRYSNTQNKINIADFYANESYHINLEQISRSTWAPDPTGGGQQTIWFYERSRGSYDEMRNREKTPAKIKTWDKLHPRRQKFDKLILAKVEQTWRLKPYTVSKGGEKNFADFMLNINGENKVTQEYFMDVVARLIIWKATEKIVTDQKIPAYRANIVAYTISWLLYLIGHRINLSEIWKKQVISNVLAATINYLAFEVRSCITDTSDNVTEWCKKEECWKKLKEKKIILPDALYRELIPDSPSVDQSLNKLTDKEYKELIREITSIEPAIWFNISKWGKITNFLNPQERNFAYATGKIISQGKIPTIKQAPQAKKIYEKALKSGFNDEFNFDDTLKSMQITF